MRALLAVLMLSFASSLAYASSLEPINVDDGNTNKGLYEISQRCGALLISTGPKGEGPIDDIVMKDAMSFLNYSDDLRLKLGISESDYVKDNRNFVFEYMISMKLADAGDLNRFELIVRDTDSCSSLAKTLNFNTSEADPESDTTKRF